jgi:hypothetical protein
MGCSDYGNGPLRSSILDVVSSCARVSGSVFMGIQLAPLDPGGPAVNGFECVDCTLQTGLVTYVVRDAFDDDVQIARVGADHTARLSLQVATLARPILLARKNDLPAHAANNGIK